MSSTPMIQMEYGYARRTAVGALYVQGLVDREVYDHVISIFKSLQIKTGHSIEFQEAALEGAVEFMLQYHHLVSSFMSKMIVLVAENYEIPQRELDDAQLFEKILETAYNEQATTVTKLGSQRPERRIIEYVNQLSSNRLGPFADFLEDIKAAAPQTEILRTPLLSAAVGYSMELAVAGLWVAGGVHHKLIEDTIKSIYAFKAEIGSDRVLHNDALGQAVELANIYAPGITADHVEVMVSMTNKLQSFRKEGEPVLQVLEVIARADRVAASA